MIQLLRSLLGGSPREYLAKKPAPSARPGQLNAGGDYRAVSLAPSRMSCGREGRRGQALFVERSAAPAPNMRFMVFVKATQTSETRTAGRKCDPAREFSCETI